ncbi:unnamed protein product [Effrenium voratum]|nr:unnamed protein product [Effrenium voratum]
MAWKLTWHWLLLPVVSAYHADDHSCGWTDKQVLWQRLRRTADSVLAGRTWTPGQDWACQISRDLANCPFGVHVLQLLDLDAAGPEAARSLDLGRSKAAGFGLYNLVTWLNLALTGWPTFGLLHRLCRARFGPADRCAAGARAPKPAVAGVVVAAAAARRLERNASDAQVLQQLSQPLEHLKELWLARWRYAHIAPAHNPVTLWLGLDQEEPCCGMWTELEALQKMLRRRFELPCASAHRRLDGAVCPGCRLAAQGFWLEDRRVADESLAQLLEGLPPAGVLQPGIGAGSFAVATVLTSEDLFRSIRHDGQGVSGDEDLADATAIVLTYVDALRTLAHSIRAAAAADEVQRRLLVLLSLRAGEAMPDEAQEALRAMELQGLISVVHLAPPPQHLWPRAWGKLQLWKLEFDLVLYLDGDILVLGSLEPLFQAAVKAPLDFAASLTRSMMAFNAGVMLVRPSMRIFEDLKKSLEELPQWQGISRWTGRPWWNAPPNNSADFGSYGDQDHLNEWVATHFAFHGELVLDASASCVRQPWQAPYEATRGNEPQQALGSFCSLPMAFNFCATATCLQQLASGEHGFAQEALRKAAGRSEPEALSRLQVLHWPGALRKPWQRCSAAVRSRLDRLWWRSFAAACAEAPQAAPCRVRCFD